MSPLLWLIPPPVAVLLAVLWNAWTGRVRGPEEPRDSVAAYERFRAALSGSAAGAGRAGGERPVDGPG